MHVPVPREGGRWYGTAFAGRVQFCLQEADKRVETIQKLMQQGTAGQGTAGQGQGQGKAGRSGLVCLVYFHE